MSNNTNERISQISALTLAYERLFNADRSIGNEALSSMIKAVNFLSADIAKGNTEEVAKMGEVVREKSTINKKPTR